MDQKQVVVVIEDDPAVCEGLKLLLEKRGYVVQTYPAVELYLQHPADLVHLFLIDKQLPGMDGVDFCRMLKTAEETRDIPVIIMSANAQAASLSREAGADAFLEKPFSQKQLSDLLGRVLPPVR